MRPCSPRIAGGVAVKVKLIPVLKDLVAPWAFWYGLFRWGIRLPWEYVPDDIDEFHKSSYALWARVHKNDPTRCGAVCVGLW
ncbi:MAG: hypothetical protein FWG12_02425 [Holophagaceae bacterium]|nr:hypothetical protein [Holophagaceae bacterium]